MSTFFFTVLLVSTLVLRLEGKRVISRVKLTGTTPEHIITKFAFHSYDGEPGTISGDFWATTKNPNSLNKGKVNLKTYLSTKALNVYLFVDEQWPAYLKALTCADRAALASQVIPIKTMDHGHDNKHDLHSDKKSNFFAKVYQDKTTSKTHYWYMVLMDCSLEQDISFKQPSGSHLPADEFWLSSISFLLILCYIIFVVRLLTGGFSSVLNIKLSIRKMGLKKIIAEIKTQHKFTLFVLLALSFDFVNHVCDFIHLWLYSSNGTGFHFLDLIGELAAGYSDYLVAGCLLTIAYGYSTHHHSLEFKKIITGIFGVPKAGSDYDKFMRMLRDGESALIGAGIFFMTIFIFLSRRDKDDFSTYHDYETSIGMMQIMMRCACAAIFCLLLTKSLNHGAKNAGFSASGSSSELRSFYVRFGIAGMIWFCAFPFLSIFASTFLATYNRHAFVNVGTTAMHTLSVYALLLLLWTKNAFSKRSDITENISMTLPSGQDSSSFRSSGIGMHTAQPMMNPALSARQQTFQPQYQQQTQNQPQYQNQQQYQQQPPQQQQYSQKNENPMPQNVTQHNSPLRKRVVKRD